MTRLGEFDAAVREVDENTERDTLLFGGVEFTVAGDVPAILMLQLGAAAGSGVEDTEGMAACWEALRRALGDRFGEFYKLALDRGTDLEEIMKLVFKLFEAQAGRPTVAAPASSDGPPNTSPSSSTSSTPAAFAHLRPVSEVLTG